MRPGAAEHVPTGEVRGGGTVEQVELIRQTAAETDAPRSVIDEGLRRREDLEGSHAVDGDRRAGVLDPVDAGERLLAGRGVTDRLKDKGGGRKANPIERPAPHALVPEFDVGRSPGGANAQQDDRDREPPE